MRTDLTKYSLSSIIVALLSAVGIFFVTDLSIVFLVLLLLNLCIAFVYRYGYKIKLLDVCRVLVGLLFIFSSFMKGIDPLGTKYKMLDYFAAYGIEWLNGLAFMLAIVMIAAEFIVGFCLTFNFLPRLAVLGATLLMIIFTFTTLFDALFDVVADCGCFGEAIKMTNWQTFYKNIVIDTMLVPLIFNNKKLANRRFGLKIQWIVSIIAVCVFGGFQLYNYYFLPSVDLLRWKKGAELNIEQEQPKIYLKYRNNATGEEREYLSPNYPWNDSVWMSEWSFVSQRSEGVQNYIGFSATTFDGEDVTDVIINSPNVFLFVSPYLDEVTESEFANIIQLQDMLDMTSASYVLMTSTDEQTIERLLSDGLIRGDVEILLGDDLELKTIVRSNPGLIWLDNGKVMGKWGRIDMERSGRLKKIINGMVEQ